MTSLRDFPLDDQVGAQPKSWFVYDHAPVSVLPDGAYLPWGVPSSGYPGRGTNPFNLDDPTQPVAIANMNIDLAIEVECDEAHAGKNLNAVVFVDLDGVDDGPGENVPLDSGFARFMIPCPRFLAAGTKIGVFAFHDVLVAIPIRLWVQASWELT